MLPTCQTQGDARTELLGVSQDRSVGLTPPPPRPSHAAHTGPEKPCDGHLANLCQGQRVGAQSLDQDPCSVTFNSPFYLRNKNITNTLELFLQGLER